MRVLAVDPGGTIGWAALAGDGSLLAWGEERDHAKFLDMAWLWLRGGEFDALVVERWIVTRGRAMTSEPDALEQIGALRWMAHYTDTACIMQSASDAKRFGTAERLRPYRDIGAGRGGGGHALMALGHALLYLASRTPMTRDGGTG